MIPTDGLTAGKLRALLDGVPDNEPVMVIIDGCNAAWATAAEHDRGGRTFDILGGRGQMTATRSSPMDQVDDSASLRAALATAQGNEDTLMEAYIRLGDALDVVRGERDRLRAQRDAVLAVLDQDVHLIDAPTLAQVLRTALSYRR